MKKIKISFLLCACLYAFTSFIHKDAYFEGVIVYEHQYISKAPTYNAKQMEKFAGSQSEFYFKNGNYKQIFNGEYMKMNIRKMKENRVYVKYSVNDTLFWWDGSIKNEAVVSSGIKDTSMKILKYKCKVFEITSNRLSGQPHSNRKYFFSPELSIDPEWYNHCEYGSENLKFSAMKALPLKIVFETGDGIMIMTAIKVTRKKLEDSFFDLPENTITAQEK